MIFSALIDTASLRERLATGAPLVLLDCSFDLADTGAGERAHAEARLPGALYAHLDRDLSSAKTGRNGRHPLPTREAFASTVGAWGVAPGVQVVTYDGQGGVYASRAWWMLHWLGHRAAAVLDGGIAAWRADGGAIESGAPTPRAAGATPYPSLPQGMATVDAATLQARLGRVLLLDARPAERFRGDVEPLDPVAGHIPGATNRFFKDNLAADGRFKPAEVLRRSFEAYGGSPQETVQQCGSGVTACHNLLAMTHAGLPGSLLYPGSWSEWCADPARPVARG
jgi:thiosulfate/3-mercaptopyruvate sulfurtransferase